MYAIIVGAGKVGRNLARELIAKGQEITLLESSRPRYLSIEEEFEHAAQYGDATELWVLERAGIQRADLVIAVTGDDEDNMLVCQVAKEKYLCDRIIARVNNPRNYEHFKLLGIQPAVSATDLILRLIEHEVPRYGLVHLLALEEDRGRRRRARHRRARRRHRAARRQPNHLRAARRRRLRAEGRHRDRSRGRGLAGA
jgi:trk system potassium uptake protein